VVRADDGRTDKHRLCVALNVLPRRRCFQHFLGALKVDVDVEVFFEFLFDIRNLLDERKLIHGLRVVGDGP